MATRREGHVLTRAEALCLFGSVFAVCSCDNRSPIRVSSKNFAESIVVAEAYACALELARLPVERLMMRGDATALACSMGKNRIDLYPEYTWTGVSAVLKRKSTSRGIDVFRTLRDGYAQFDATWLTPASAASNAQRLATHGKSPINTMSQCSRAAPHLHLAAQKEFFERADGLPGVRKAYGGFNFGRITSVEKFGQQYDLLRQRVVDVVAVSQTDPQIVYDRLKVLTDDLQMWPAYNIAPVIRREVLVEYPQVQEILSQVTRLLSQNSLEQLDAHIYDDGRDPADVAQSLVRPAFHLKSS